MPQPIKILLAEDSIEDAELLWRALHKLGYDPEWQQVDTEEAFLDALHAGLDLVLSDYSMPQFTGLRALELVKARHPEIPFIIVSGTIGEETAVEAMRLGATDFLLKNRLGRLGPAVGRALELGRLRREQREGEAALRAREERFRNLIEHASDMISVVDGDGVIRYQSPSTPRLLGYPPGTMLGRPAAEYIHPDDRPKVGEAIRQALLALDDPVTVEFRIRHQDDTWRVLQSSGKRMTDNGGTPQIVVNSRDVTEHRTLEKQFLHAQRMEAIGTLAGGMAHDLNNILAPVLMVAGLLKIKLTSPQDQRILSMVENSAQRGADIIRQLLMFSRGVTGERVSVQLRHLTKEMADIMRETFPRGITIRHEAPGELWPVVGDATQLHQVLMNLCVNARDAMPKGGQLTLDAGNVELDDLGAELPPEAKAGRYVMLSVADTGQGIPPEIAGRIFDPFFTTKGIGKGTGLGLSTVLGIVRSHGGFVTVHSEPGKGTAFRVYLPVATVPAGAGPVETEAAVPGEGETILVVDDEAPVCLSTSLILEQQNYRVLVAHNGREALDLFLQHQHSIKVVLTDIMMPVMGGLDLARALRTTKPDLTIMAATGLDHEDSKLELKELGITEVLLKPYVPDALLAALSRALKRR
jgi:two-component system cell cycle sensor histidine kinase/response regulator CckA